MWQGRNRKRVTHAIARQLVRESANQIVMRRSLPTCSKVKHGEPFQVSPVACLSFSPQSFTAQITDRLRCRTQLRSSAALLQKHLCNAVSKNWKHGALSTKRIQAGLERCSDVHGMHLAGGTSTHARRPRCAHCELPMSGHDGAIPQPMPNERREAKNYLITERKNRTPPSWRGQVALTVRPATHLSALMVRPAIEFTCPHGEGLLISGVWGCSNA